jgi:hypothetical protein
MDLEELLDDFEPISLEGLDERARLLRRVDNKYAVPEDTFAELAQRLKADHQVLEVDGRRISRYSTTYFETPDLRCFRDHIGDHVPRFKVRTRLYEDTGECAFEVKLKRSGDETDKRQIPYSREDRRRVTSEARECLRTALEDAGLAVPEELTASLTSSFARVTFAARAGGERVTCDLDVRLIGPDDQTAVLGKGRILVETKSETGESPADSELAQLDVEPVSLSKYRVGMSLVGAAEGFGSQPGSELFEKL